MNWSLSERRCSATLKSGGSDGSRGEGVGRGFAAPKKNRGRGYDDEHGCEIAAPGQDHYVGHGVLHRRGGGGGRRNANLLNCDDRSLRRSVSNTIASSVASSRCQQKQVSVSKQAAVVPVHSSRGRDYTLALANTFRSPSASDGPTYAVGASALDDLRRQRSVEHCLVLCKGLISEFPFQLE